MAKRQPVDRPFVNKLPKIELHAHLSGSISRKCLHDIWLAKKEAQPELDLPDPLVAIPPSKVDYDLKTFFPLFNTYIYRLVSDIPSIHESTLRVLADFEEDGVVYLELRTTPREIPEYTISRRRYVETVLSAIEEYERNKDNRMRTRLILSIDRRNSLAQAKETVDIALEFQSRGVVGIDLCGDPSVTSIAHLSAVFYKASIAGLNIVLHFAEAEVSASDEELRMLLSWNPSRLGHVIHVKDEFKRMITEKKIGLELCLSCNVHAKMITGTFGDHHFGEWKDCGHKRIALCTDDVGVFCSTLSNEYYLAAEHFGMSREELITLAENVVDMIFATESVKDEIRALFKQFRLDEARS
ncbi:adenosine deaminase, variant [Verruconis gallopava]|nr:adenosine deaminase, variant [Verruconis gallopava]KIW03755.1 adenosine deaminase, variant [Verruconis gallopava]